MFPKIENTLVYCMYTCIQIMSYHDIIMLGIMALSLFIMKVGGYLESTFQNKFSKEKVAIIILF